MMEKTGYGETLGSERYRYFGGMNERGWGSDGVAWDLRLNYASYEGEMYYEKNGYLWKSKEDGARPKIIREIDSGVSIFVNAYGIYVIGEKITAYDFGGNEKAVIDCCDKICSYYICDSRVYLITCDGKEAYSAVWHDIETQQFHRIYATKGRVSLGVNSEGMKSYQCIRLSHIMANQKRAVFWIDFCHYYYPEDEEREEALENEAGGWYSYEFSEGKLRCINCGNVQPHTCVTSPRAFWERREEYRKLWRSIAFFDMKRDVMWIQRDLGGSWLWEPKEIGSGAGARAFGTMPTWTVRERPSKGRPSREFFDGRRRFQAGGALSLYSYDQNGNASANLYRSPYQAADKFQVCGDYIFYVDDGLGNEKQFSLAQNPPRLLRPNWMQSHFPKRFSEEEGMAEDNFLNGKNGLGSASALCCAPDEEVGAQRSAPAFHGAVVEGSGAQRSAPAEGSCLAYWQEFVDHAFGNAQNKRFLDARFLKSAPADRNWHALRFGTSKAHIELSFSRKKKTARTALFVRDKERFALLESTRGYLNDAFRDVDGNLVWDGMSKLSSVSIVREGFDFCGNRTAQFEWFMMCAWIFKKISEVAVLEG